MTRILLVYFLLSWGFVQTCTAQESIGKDTHKKEEASADESLSPDQLDSIPNAAARISESNLVNEQATIASAISEVESVLAANPANQEALGIAAELYGIQDDHASLSSTTDQMKNLGMYATYSPYFDLLHEQMDSKELLLTNGESDTRPLLMRGASAKGSYKILRLDWLDDESLRPSLERLGYALPPANVDDALQIAQLYSLNPQLRIVLSPTLDHQTLIALQAQLKTCGLVFSLGERKGKSNERIYLSVYDQINELTEAELKQSGMNYLPMLAEVRTHYVQKQNERGKSDVEELIRSILVANDRLDLYPVLTGN